VPRLAVIGWPVGHSRSPAMQSAALEAAGLGEEWSYGAIAAQPGAFEATVKELASVGYAGINVTVPHKEAALALADEASEEARMIGAANTLSFEGGRVKADNTDAGGLVGALGDMAGRLAPPAAAASSRALVLGGGGAARAAIWGLAHAGEIEGGRLGPFAVDVWNRTRARVEAVYEELGGEEELGGGVVDSPALDDYAVIVNTTSVGLQEEDPFEELPLRAEGFVEGQLVVDMVYGDRPSALLEAAQRCDARTVDGLEILVQQGARSFELWTGRVPDLNAMRAAARAPTGE
jgi:shikimate dehydrogenase